ncbi:MAG: preprotein translocase subunit SecA [Verrucomicrobiota bacterium]
MVTWILKKILGSKNQRELRRILPLVKRINEIETGLQNESEDALRERTKKWQTELAAFEKDLDKEIADWVEAEKAKLTQPEGPERVREEQGILETARKKKNEGIDDVYDAQSKYLEEILPEAYAIVKNGARRLCGSTISVCDQPIEWNMVHFDVQLIGGVALHRNMIAEMATGEGKTLVATLPVYLNALTVRGVHVITVNDYLARRDSEWMGELFKFLGLTVGVIQNQLPPDGRREAYNCDITYGTNSEFGFDYLRDNGMATSKATQVQRDHYFAIIDEVDSVLIDEARTPLIISGPVARSTSHQFDRFKGIVSQIVKKQNVLCNEAIASAKKAIEDEDYESGGRDMYKVKLGQPRNRGLLRLMEEPANRKAMEQAELSMLQDQQKKALFELKEELFFTIDEKAQDADLSEQGRSFLNPDDPDAFVLPDLATEFAGIDGEEGLSDVQKAKKKEELQSKLDSQGEKIHAINQLLRAYCLYERDVQYVVEDNKVIIVDEGTGRKMVGRRWSDGLHQAVEAKEGVRIDQETQTLATITIQNYFRLYEKLAGMTGTAETEAAEFHDIYNLDVLIIPTNRPIARIDQNDHIYKTRREKYNAAIEIIKEHHAKGQPILVGTASVEASETVSRMLKREKITHNVLNAKYHRQEAEIIQRAGQKGTVTVSTNMAGRGTDIKLGEGIADVGGLLVVATERHTSRRVDRQLRGRCARQGDPGESIFFISFEDDLMRNFGAAERMTKMMERFGLEEGQELQHSWLNRSVETAQKRVEQRDYMIRKHVLDYDDVMNQQREVVYGYRNEVIETASPRELIGEAIEKAVPGRVGEFFAPMQMEEPADIDGLVNWVNSTFPLAMTRDDLSEGASGFDGNYEDVSDRTSEFIVGRIKETYDLKCAHEDPERLTELERYVILTAVDKLWQEHLYAMDGIREGISLRRHGQKDPLIEYKNEAFVVFQELMDSIDNETLSNLFRSSTNLQSLENFFANLQRQGSQNTAAGIGFDNPGAAPQTTNTGAGQGSGPQGVQPRQAPEIAVPIRREQPKVGRNEPCPCGSGKKYKQCCGRKA